MTGEDRRGNPPFFCLQIGLSLTDRDRDFISPHIWISRTGTGLNRLSPGLLVLTGLLVPLVPGQAEGQLSWPRQIICGLEQLRIIGMLQLARKLPFVISGIRNYELSTIGQGIPTWGEGL
jgi:hypothetical protein